MANGKKVMLTDMDRTRMAAKADSMDIYTVDSDQKGVLYMWDGKYIALYFHGAVIKLKVDEAETILEEMQMFLDDVKDFLRMNMKFKGLSKARGDERCLTTEE